MKHKLLALILALMMLLMPAFAQAEVIPKMSTYAPEGVLLDSAVECKAAVLMDVATGTVLYGLNADEQRAPASITKVMTCLVTLEYLEQNQIDLGTTITVCEMPAWEQGATLINLSEGERITLRDLLYGLMLNSGNDAAYALAVYVGGSIAGFSELMNAKAKALGMDNSHFVNPHGLTATDHYVTARDMGKLLCAALQNGDFRALISRVTYTCPPTNHWQSERYFRNTNRLIRESETDYYYPYCIGGKTGYTYAAGYTLVCAGERDGRTVAAVVLGAETTYQRFMTGSRLLEYGLSCFEELNLTGLLGNRTRQKTIAVSQQDPNLTHDLTYVTRDIGDEPTILLETGARIADLSVDLSLFDEQITWFKTQAPINKDEVIGEAVYYLGSDEVYRCELVAAESVAAIEPTPTPRPNFFLSAFDFKDKTPWYFLVITLCVVFAILMLMIVRTLSGHRRKRRRSYRTYRRTSRHSASHTASRRRRH